jgi:pimeloyl-ACP methyl ester carboxylesterase
MCKEDNMVIHRRGTAAKPVLILVHSLWLSHEMFQTLIERYEHAFDIYAFDVYGHGESDDCPIGVTDLNAIAQQVVHQLDDCGVDKSHFLGQSMGADIVLRIALAMPHRVESMVLIGGSCGPTAPERLAPMNEWISGLTDTGFRAEDRKKARNILLGESTRSSEDRVSLVEWVDKELEYLTPSVIPVMHCVFARGGVCQELSELEIPSLVITGAEDRARGIAHGQQLATNLNGSQFVQIEACGHSPILEQFETCADELSTFWNRSLVATHV